jgi:hypothetical protein
LGESNREDSEDSSGVEEDVDGISLGHRRMEDLGILSQDINTRH